MRYSICSWTFANTPLKKVFEMVSSAGYEYIDVQALVDEYNWTEVNRLAEESSLKISGLLGDSGWPDEKHDLANKSKSNRDKAVEYFKRQIECVKVVGGDYLIVVPSAVGKFFTMGNTKTDDWNWAIESVRNIADTAKEYDITLIIEPINRYESCIVNNSDDALNFVKDINHPNVKTLLDTYHMNIEEDDLEEAFLKLKDWVEVVHMADSNRKGIGRGHIDFEKIVTGMKKIGFDKTIVVECTAPGPNPFQPNKGKDTAEIMQTFAQESLVNLKKWFN
ncbi:sugar phosphate isomerase/epimerase [Salibacterium salarium]|uniref:Sugar phosphate isomerase/epimerase n=1 Tax=Salibacterium salarium TaxID=284579 RepID=A0A3R9Q183_9BACI|nr:sugar phosphate isomerase/epimerase [Salibacterium salarium]RSL31456.1 sugar phosphate isomerase/epimerase [Salibacterium salarium]